MLGPELFVYIAYRQRGSAAWLVCQAKEHLDLLKSPRRRSSILNYGSQAWAWMYSLFCTNSSTHDSKPSDNYTQLHDGHSPRRQYAWTLVHGFYASMGGFVIETIDKSDSNSESFMPEPGCDYAVLTPQGVEYLMKHDPDLIPDISEDAIMDHSKADGFAKLVQLSQAIWFCLSCISRLAQHLPLSLLEVSTFAHAMCTLATYLLWWHKPLNIGEHTVIKGDRAREVCALLRMSGISRTYRMGGLVCNSFAEESRFIGINTNPRRSYLHPSSYLTRLPYDACLEGTPFFPTLAELPPYQDRWRRLTRSSKRMDLMFNGGRPWYIRIDLDRNLGPCLYRSDVLRWQLASRAFKRYGLQELPSQWAFAYVAPQAELQSSTDAKGAAYGSIIRTSLGAAMLSVIYGSPHFLGWIVEFPTPLEEMLWKSATIIVTSAGAFFGTMFIASIGIFRLTSGSKRNCLLPSRARVEDVLMYCAATVYCSAGAFLVVESFRQLFYLPPRSYNLPSWSNYFPHFS